MTASKINIRKILFVSHLYGLHSELTLWWGTKGFKGSRQGTDECTQCTLCEKRRCCIHRSLEFTMFEYDYRQKKEEYRIHYSIKNREKQLVSMKRQAIS
jgi:hypothetical protein